MSWQNLEDLMKNLLAFDNAITIPGSGNGKGEEDVIGLSTITQCKYSEKQNITILRKDIDRLLEAAKLQNKVPIFATENEGLILISIPECIISKDILHLIIGMSLVRFVKFNCETPLTRDEKKEYRKLLRRGRSIIDSVHSKYNNFCLECDMNLQDKDDNLKWLKELEEHNEK
jgi:hypothetical protein